MSTAPPPREAVTPPPHIPESTSGRSTPGSVFGMTRTRAEYDADSGDDTLIESPHPKLARTSVDATMGNDTDEIMAEDPNMMSTDGNENDDPTALALLEELECGMCAGVFIEPVALNGCGHVFCGSCTQQWIKSLPRYPTSLLPGDPVPEAISCPHCRYTPIQTATPSRLAKSMVAFLLSRMPTVARPPNELRQAAELYRPSMGALKFPTPPAPPRALTMNEYWRPCRSCYPTEEGAWKCPIPVARFDVPAERDRCVRIGGIPPDGHRLCAGCDRLSPGTSPSSANCGICGEGFCGESITGCDCVPVSQSKTSDLFNHFSNVLADCPSDTLALAFKDNWTEMGHLSVYLAQMENTLEAPQIYQAILAWLRSSEGTESGGLLGMMERAEINLRLRTGMAEELQKAIMPAEEGAVEAKICPGCADEIFCAGIFEWWMRELKKPGVAENRPTEVKSRPDCKYGKKCARQDNDRHSKKFNHICHPLSPDQAALVEQDDTLPAPVAPVNTTRATHEGSVSSDMESDDESCDEDDEDRPECADVSTQWDDTAIEKKVTITIDSPILSKWLPSPAPRPASIFSPQASTLSIANIVNAEPMSTANGIGNSRASSPRMRASSPHLFSLSAPRVSGSASSPLTGNFSWPSVTGASLRRAQTPPLGLSFLNNATAPTGAGSADSDLAASTAAKLSLPMSPSPNKARLAFLGDPNVMLAGSASQMSSQDTDS